MGWGNGIGIGWPNASAGVSYVKKLIKTFKERVLSYPNSIFEAEPCLDATLTELNAIGLLKQASLVITPNAYKESVLYSVVPNTTLGDMNVVRATTATRVNSAGLIEVVPRNLLTYSNTFTNAAWGNAGYGNIATVIANDIISPDGLMNGSKITFSAGVTQGRLVQQTSVINGRIYQASIFVKYGNKNTIQFYCDAAVIGLFATFNFTTKVLTGSGVSNTIVTELPNGWFRLQYTYTAPSATSQIGFISNIGEDGFIYAYGGQAEQGSTATEYFPTTTRLNIPRIDYTNGSCPSLLVEPQRTNLLTYSNTFTNAAWDKGITTINANVIISPDGTLNASKLSDTLQGNNTYRLYNSVTLSAQSYTQTFYAKAAEYNWCYVRIGNALRAWFNVSNGTVGQVASGLTGSITSVGNGWYKITCTITTASAGGGFALIGLCTGDGIESYTPTTGGKGIYIWGAQLEAGSYATSYIPTVASSVTRNADVISKTGISSLIGQTEGVLFVESAALFNDLTPRLFSLSNGTTTNRIFINYSATSNTIGLTVVSAGITILNINYLVSNTTQFAKIAVRYSNTLGYSLWVNGVNRGSNALVTIPAFMSRLGFDNGAGGTFFFSKTKQVQLYKTALSDTEMATLTTL